MLDGGINTIYLPPFGVLGGEVPTVLLFLRLRLERLVVVQVDGGGIIDALGRGRDRDRCAGDVSRYFLGYVRYEAPGDIGSDGQIHCFFLSVSLISLRPR